MSVDHWLTKTHDSKTYNCLHFVRDVWLELCGQDLREGLEAFFAAFPAARLSRRSVSRFRELGGPISPCLVLFQRPRHPPHWAVFLRGKVLDIQPTGARFVPLDVAAIGFTKVRFALPV